MAKDHLADYRRKRDFAKSPEPAGSKSRRRVAEPGFVVQKHAASTLHYDFRLEVDGVLKSWAVPKGPSLNPADKRLAAPTEDHPLDYADFEGIIPEGYGAGTVIVWDRGTYRNLREDEGCSMQESLDDGKVEVWLEGQKLHGGYAIVEMKGRRGWLLIKKDDEAADADANLVESAPASVVTGRTLEDVAGRLSPTAEEGGGAVRGGRRTGSSPRSETRKRTAGKARSRKAGRGRRDPPGR